MRLASRSRRARALISLLGSAPCSALNTSVACVPDCVGKRCSSRSWARCDSMPGTVKSSLKAPPAAIGAADQGSEDDEARRGSCGAGRRPTNDARDVERREDMARHNNQTEFRNQLSLYFGLSVTIVSSWPGSGNARSERRGTPSATPPCGCSSRTGSPHTTFDRIAEAADVSRATVFSYFPTKEEIVMGEGAAAIGALAATLAERPAGQEDDRDRPRVAGRAVGLVRARARLPAPARARGPGRRRAAAAAPRRAPERRGRRAGSRAGSAAGICAPSSRPRR